jgi:hypothetical protein
MCTARRVLDGHGQAVHIHTARQDVPGPALGLGEQGAARRAAPRARRPPRPRLAAGYELPWLPGWVD